jgi:hypothetical protein
MTTIATRYALGLTLGFAPALAAALALAAFLAAMPSAQTDELANSHAPAGARMELAQYCAPIEEASADTHRFYCRNRHGWDSEKPMPTSDSPT